MGKETLTPKQRLFCYEYVLDHNGKRSYQAAYPNCKAPGSAESQASRLLTRALLALPAGLCNRWVLVAPGGRQQEGTVRQMR
nr:MAG TPA: Terminase small subunit [Caudoviricetes sp.]